MYSKTGKRSLIGAAWALGMLGGLGASARAQSQDFATCPESLTACAGDTHNCCYRSFGPGTIVIPMDRCHQVMNEDAKHVPKTSSLGGTGEKEESPVWCGDWGTSADDGMWIAYGLVYRLMQAGVPVHWAVNPTKDPPVLTTDEAIKRQVYTDRDVDLWVLSPGTATPPPLGTDLSSCTGGCVDPVKRLDANLVPIADSYNFTAFPIRGSSFVIAPEGRAAFDTFWAAAKSKNPAYYDFSSVDLYEVQANATVVVQDFNLAAPYPALPGAHVAVVIDYPPPRLARNAPAGVSEIWLGKAKLDQEAAYPGCLTGPFSPSDAVYCDLRESDFRAGHLLNGEFGWAWIDRWEDNSPCANGAELAHMTKFEDFLSFVPGVREAGHVMFMEKSIETVEGCTGHEPMGKLGRGLSLDNMPVKEAMILRYPGNLYMQFGDLPVQFANGAVAAWQYWGKATPTGTDAIGYEPSHYDYANGGTLVRLVTQDESAAGNALCTGHRSTSTCDIFQNSASADILDVATYLRFQDDPRNGIVFYMGGNNVNSIPSQLRMILNALIATPAAPYTNPPPPTPTVDTEVARSAPIVTTVDGYIAQLQATYDFQDPPPLLHQYSGAASDATFEFPYYLGHLRAIDSEVISDTGSSFATIAEIFDAADHIPPTNPAGCGSYFGSTCRTIFTNVTSARSGGVVPRTYFTTANADTLQPLIAPGMTTAEARTLISRVHAGRYDAGVGGYVAALGGINRSTMAVIGQSPLVPTVRPKIAYVGALDGMMHAICAEALDYCDELGQELWAYLPRTQLGRLRKNTQRIDGSPKVADILGDFDSDGDKEYKTVMVFQTGVGMAGFVGDQPAVIAMDISNPSQPQILWEVTAPATRSTHELGVGLTVAMGPIMDGGGLRHLVYIQSNEGGTTASPGMVVTAVDTVTGEEVWQVGFTYPNPRSSSNPPVPATGYPGGVAVIDLTTQGSNSHVIATSLYGDVWMLDATSGASVTGSSPVFRFSSDFHPIGAPPTVYRDSTTGKLHVLVVTGGYGDLINSSWAPDGVDQYAVAFPIDPIPGSTINEDGGSFKINLGPTRAFSQAVISGDSIFIVTDEADVNSSSYGVVAGSGRLNSYSLSGGGSPLTVGVVLPGGAASVDVAGNTVYSGAGSAAQKVDVSDVGAGGSVVTEWGGPPTLRRALWLRIR